MLAKLGVFDRTQAAVLVLLIAVMHTLNRLNTDSEIIVLTASGATNWTAARPVVMLALLVAAFVGYVNHIGMPWSLRNLRTIVVDVRTDLLTQVIQRGPGCSGSARAASGSDARATGEIRVVDHVDPLPRHGELPGQDLALGVGVLAAHRSPGPQ